MKRLVGKETTEIRVDFLADSFIIKNGNNSLKKNIYL